MKALFLFLLASLSAAKFAEAFPTVLIEQGSKITNVELKSMKPRSVTIRFGAEKPQEIALQGSDQSALMEPVAILIQSTQHERRYCNRRALTLITSTGKSKLFCLESKTPAGEAARTLSSRLSLLPRLRGKPKVSTLK